MKIVVIEDNIGDVILIKDVFNNDYNLEVKTDGQQAINFFENLDENSSLPNLILLDLNLPIFDGKEVLKFLKNHKNLKYIPVVVFTSSNSLSDIKTCYKLNANAYILKPINLDDYVNKIKSIENFWLTNNVLYDKTS